MHVSVTAKFVQPGTVEATVHDRLTVAELLVEAVTLHDEDWQPAAVKAGFASLQISVLNCGIEVPGCTSKLVESVTEVLGIV